MRALLLAAALWPAASAAQQTLDCPRTQDLFAVAAIGAARSMAHEAGEAVADDDIYARWFGPFDKSRAVTVRHNLKGIAQALEPQSITAICLTARDPDCKDGTYAFVFQGAPRVIHLCPAFFSMPSMADQIAGRRSSDDGTREGTIVHEISHFYSAGGTDDHCYGRGVCAETAKTDPDVAIENADSYQYFAEDVRLAE